MKELPVQLMADVGAAGAMALAALGAVVMVRRRRRSISS
jgi:MYXO-CTERM domain-containing protein